MTSTALNSEERAVRDCLRDEYNVPEVAFIGGSRHPRAEFTYHRKRCVLTLHNPGNGFGASTIDMKLRDLRRLIGEPPVQKPNGKTKRTLDEMTTELQAKASTPLIYNGKIAQYYNGKTNACMRFFLPPEIALYLGERCAASRMAHQGGWVLSRSTDGGSRIHRDHSKQAYCDGGVGILLPGLEGPFGKSSAEYWINDKGAVCVKPLRDQIKPVKVHRTRTDATPVPPLEPESPVAVKSPEPEPPPAMKAPEPTAEAPAAAQPVTTTEPDHRAVLAAIVRLEAAGPYRLIRRKDTGSWAWQAPLIEMNE